MKSIDRNKPVLVTGANGYVASWLVKRLLDEGMTVHAAVRNPSNKSKVGHLKKLAENSKGSIKFFKSNLVQKGSYSEAMEGCELVFHTASPFFSCVKNPEKELIKPAMLGTKNVLEEANNNSSVKRVILTSSCAAIYSDNIDLKNTPKGVFTEEIWNESASADHRPYSYSKVLAEKEAWSIYKSQNKWDLVVLNPSLVMGPALNPKGITSESYRILKQFGNGALKSGVPKLGFGVVDVRDLAEAHYRAAFMPEAKGRYIISGHNTYFIDMAKTLLPSFGKNYPIPKREIPKILMWIFGPSINQALTRKYVRKNIGYPFIADNTKSIEELGLTYRPLENTMVDSFKVLIENRLI